MNIIVTQDDIDRGRASSPAACPVSLAVQRATGADTVRCFPSWIEVCNGENSRNYRPPHAARNFMKLFDLHKSAVFPFTFRMEVKP